jgi:hypothetical protein
MPTELTWGEMRDQAVASFATTTLLMQSIIYDMKRFLAGAIGPGGAGIWTVAESCDGTGGAGSFGMSDKWNAGTKIVRAAAGSNHSWCRLTNATLGLECVLDVNGTTADTYPLSVWFAPAFGTAGTATARPTGTYEWGAQDALPLDTNHMLFSAAAAAKVHGLLSTRGDFWFFASMNFSSAVYSALGVCRLSDAKAGDLMPFASYFAGTNLALRYNTLSYYAVESSFSGTNLPFVRCRTYNRTALSNADYGNCAGIIWPIVACNYTSPPMSIGGPLYGAGPGRANSLSLTFPAYVAISSSLYCDFKGRWPDMLLGHMSLAANTISPIVGAQERLKIGACWLPFVGGPLSL